MTPRRRLLGPLLRNLPTGPPTPAHHPPPASHVVGAVRLALPIPPDAADPAVILVVAAQQLNGLNTSADPARRARYPPGPAAPRLPSRRGRGRSTVPRRNSGWHAGQACDRLGSTARPRCACNVRPLSGAWVLASPFNAKACQCCLSALPPAAQSLCGGITVGLRTRPGQALI